jgi:hypothetical protein
VAKELNSRPPSMEEKDREDAFQEMDLHLRRRRIYSRKSWKILKRT